MKQFSFSMQYLADFHAAREQAAEQALSSALKEQVEAECVLQRLMDRRAELAGEIGKIHGIVRRSEWSEKMRYVQGYERRIVQHRGELGQLTEKVQRCRDLLKEEMKQRRVLEKLEKNERCRWSEAVQYEEQKQMDELAASRWFRQEELV